MELSVDHNVFREEIVRFSPTLRYSSHFHSTNYRCHLPRLHKIYPTNTVMHLNVVKPYPPRKGSVQIRAEGRFLISLGTQLQWRVIDQRFTWVACRVTAATDGSTKRSTKRPTKRSTGEKFCVNSTNSNWPIYYLPVCTL